jgi:hypothetical protein
VSIVETTVAVGCFFVNGIVAVDGAVTTGAVKLDSAVASTDSSALR